MKGRLDSISLLIILLIGGALRYWDYLDIPFSHDEYSVLFRTGFDNWNDLIRKGVMVDTHPAGIQVFLNWWTELLGMTEWVMKLPFTLFGMGSIYLTYRIGKDWFNITVGLISAAFMASLQYPILYSQLARPYISGLFFCLLTTHFWWRLINSEKREFFKRSIPFIISASLCTYNHHFSALMAAIIGLTGLLFISRKQLHWYILSGVVIFILYIPHLPVFLHQLGKGGVGAWLGKPSPTFILDYLKYVSQFSIMPILLTIIIGIRFRSKKVDWDKKRNYYTSLIWFLLPLLIGYGYSIFGSSVLQYSVLIFSFPFLLFAFFGFTKRLSGVKNIILVQIILWLNSISLIYGRQHYELMYNSVYENILDDSNLANEKNSELITIYNSHEKITNYLVENKNLELNPNYFWYNDSANSIADLKEFLFLNQGSRIFLGTLSRSEPLLIPLILDEYPFLVEQNDYFGGSTLVLDKKLGNSPLRHLKSLNLKDIDSKNWAGIDIHQISKDSIDGRATYQFSKNEWGPTYQSNLGLISETNDILDIRIKARSSGYIEEALIVSSIEKTGESIHWSASPFKKFYSNGSSSDEWHFFHHTIRLADIPEDHDDLTLKTFIWNKGIEDLDVKSFEIQVIKGNPVIYGLYEPIEQ